LSKERVFELARVPKFEREFARVFELDEASSFWSEGEESRVKISQICILPKNLANSSESEAGVLSVSSEVLPVEARFLCEAGEKSRVFELARVPQSFS
jgi:hypothetical protein